MITLYKEKKNCCGCAACANVCPVHAITMIPDENGFIFPKIDSKLCICCRKCISVCTYHNEVRSDQKPIVSYAAVNKDDETLLSSASGGVFVALAQIILERNGIVFGCAYNEDMEPKHISIDNPSDIKRIQGSKYVQSDIDTTYTEVKNYLNKGRWVLYTGVPCQIAGLKSYLGQEYKKLITADIICHGVPSAEFFKGYIKYLEKKIKGKVIDYNFRDKSNGWGLQARITYQARNGKINSKIIPPLTSYYYNYFLKGDIYRESCYECKYACGTREGDFTLGDYWGVEKAHPELETKNGVSVLLVNNEKGIALVEELSRYLDLTRSSFEQARKQNGQLNIPTAKSEKRDAILKAWREGGCKVVADQYFIDNKKEIILFKFKRMIPRKTKKMLKRIVKRIVKRG